MFFHPQIIRVIVIPEGKEGSALSLFIGPFLKGNS